MKNPHLEQTKISTKKYVMRATGVLADSNTVACASTANAVPLESFMDKQLCTATH